MSGDKHGLPDVVVTDSVSSIVNGRTWKHLEGPVRTPGQIGRRAQKKEAA